MVGRFRFLWREATQSHTWTIKGPKWEDAMRVVLALCRQNGWDPVLYLKAQAETLGDLHRRHRAYPVPGHLTSPRAVERFGFWKKKNIRTTGNEECARRSDKSTAAAIAFAIGYLIYEDTWSRAVHDARCFDQNFFPHNISAADKLESLAAVFALLNPALPMRVTVSSSWDWDTARDVVAILRDLKPRRTLDEAIEL